MMTLRQHRRHYYTRPAYTSDPAARLRRSRMAPGVNWLSAMRYVRKNIADIQRDRILNAPRKPDHLIRLSDLLDFGMEFVRRYGSNPPPYEPTPVPGPACGGSALPCLAPRPGRQWAIHWWSTLWALENRESFIPPGYRAGIQGVPWYRQMRRRKPRCPRFYTPDQFRRKVIERWWRDGVSASGRANPPPTASRNPSRDGE
jgi:hypothetical protein